MQIMFLKVFSKIKQIFLSPKNEEDMYKHFAPFVVGEVEGCTTSSTLSHSLWWFVDDGLREGLVIDTEVVS